MKTPQELMNNHKYFVSIREIRHVSYEIAAYSMGDAATLALNLPADPDKWEETDTTIVERRVLAIALGGFVYDVSKAFPDGTDEVSSS